MTDDEPFDPRLAERLGAFDRATPPAARTVQERRGSLPSRRWPVVAAAAALALVVAAAIAAWPRDNDRDVATAITTTSVAATTDASIPDPTSTSSLTPLPTVDPPATPMAVALAGTGTDVSIHDMTAQWPRNTPQAEIPARIGNLTTWNDNVVTLPDGRAVVRGIWDADEPVETWFRFRNFAGDPPEPTYRTDRPIRLFVVDLTTSEIVPLSPLTEFHTIQTATTESYFYEIPLEFEVSDDGPTVRFTTGFSGAAYDIPYTLWEVEVPDRP